MPPETAPHPTAEVNPTTGLASEQVAERVAAGRTNQVPDAPVRTLPQILRANVFSPVNGIMLALFAAILIAGFPRDGLFVGVVVSNAVIGVAQEIRAKRELDKLAVLSAPQGPGGARRGGLRSWRQRGRGRRSAGAGPPAIRWWWTGRC